MSFRSSTFETELLADDDKSVFGQNVGFLGNTIVHPTYDSNDDLLEEITKSVMKCLDFSQCYPITIPKLLIYRTGNRPGDTFSNMITSKLGKDDGQKVYLIVAMKVNDKDISEWIPADLQDNVFKITIESGSLYGFCSSPCYWFSNRNQLLMLAKKLSRDYSIPMRKTPHSFSCGQIACITTGFTIVLVVGIVLIVVLNR